MTIETQTAKLIACIAENLPADLDEETMQGWIDNPKGLQKFLRDLCPPKVVSTPESSLDFIIRVERSTRPSYPDWADAEWIGTLEFRALENSGPTKYDLSKLEPWLHEGQKAGRVTGQVLYDHLESSDEFTSCLNLQDGFAIQQKGIAVFRKLFGGKAVFLWKSVVRRRAGGLRVPYLYEHNDEVILSWGWLSGDWGSGSPALRFRK